MFSDTRLPNAALLMGSYARRIVYTESALCALRGIANVVLDVSTDTDWQSRTDALAEVDLLFTSWGAPVFNAETLALMPRLRGIFHGAGSIRSFVTDAFWERAIPICSAAQQNAVPVAEYAFAQIILCLKQSYHLARATRERKSYVEHDKIPFRVGSYRAVVGLVSLGEIARQLLERLHTLDVQVQVYDPFLCQADAQRLGITLVDLPTLFKTSDVVSVHTPWLPQTEGMITGGLLASLKRGAAFINTARGAVVDEIAMGQVLAQRPDVQAILDVTYPEPSPQDSPLYTLPNVFLTPHIAGSLDRECARMGDAMVAEATRLLAGESLTLQVTPEIYAHMA